MTLDGGEVSRPQTHGQPLSETQREVLHQLRWRGTLRSAEVGVIVHAMRENATCGPARRAAGCCQYAAVDGNEAMKRLMERGLVRRTGERGVWAPAELGGT